MEANRWFFLRHKDGFTPDLFGCVDAGFHIWAAFVTANLEVWEKVPDYRDVRKPTYEFGDVQLSNDRTTITLPIGGDPRYIGAKLFEDLFPWHFTHHLPLCFRLDLELGRKDTFGWFSETRWSWQFDRDKANDLRQSPQFRRPIGDAPEAGPSQP